VLHIKHLPFKFTFLSVTAVMQFAIATHYGGVLVSNWKVGRQATQLPLESNALHYAGRLAIPLYLPALRAAVRSACGEPVLEF